MTRHARQEILLSEELFGARVFRDVKRGAIAVARTA